MRTSHVQACTLTVALAVAGGAHAQTLSDSQVSKVKNNLASAANSSWELGTQMEALIELDTPSFSVFNASSLPLFASAPSSLGEVFSIAQRVLATRPGGSGPQPLVGGDGSAGDPASTGVGVLLANWTNQQNAGQAASAAASEAQFLLQDVPRASNGAISHRTSEVQLWSDNVYMVPPFLALYGVTTGNQSMLQEAYNQIKLYRDNLRDAGAGNLWKHIVLGSTGTDSGHWSTGNAWAAAGITRVLATIKHSAFAGAMGSQQSDLAGWAAEIHGGMYAHQRSDGLFNNYADDGSSFADAASATLLAASVYRLYALTGDASHLSAADSARQRLFATNGGHVGGDGWLTPVVDPYNIGKQGQHSPEAQAFVLELHAAWRDWNAAGAQGLGGGKKNSARPAARAAGVGAVVLGTVLALTGALLA